MPDIDCYFYNQKMKLLTLIAVITVITLCKETVTQAGQSTLDQIKSKAKQVHRKLDSNSDGSVTYDEISRGVKDALGIGQSDDSKSYTQMLYQKLIGGQKNCKMTEEDFEELFHVCYDKQKEYRKKTLLQKAKNKAAQIRSNLDTDKDSSISLQQLINGLKAGLGFEVEQSSKKQERDQKTLTQYAEGLYKKYVQSDKQNIKKGLTDEDLSDIVFRKMSQAKQFISDKASQAKDGLSNLAGAAIQSGKNAADTISEKASKIKDSVSENSQDLIEGAKDKASQVSDSAADKASQIKQAVLKKSAEAKQGLSNLADSAVEAGKNVADKISNKASQIKDSISENSQDLIDKASEKASQIKQSVLKKSSQAKQGIQEGLQNLAESAKDAGKIVADKISEKAGQAKQGLSNLAGSAASAGKKVIDGISDKASEIKDTISQKSQDLVEGAKEKAGQILDGASQIKQNIKQKASQAKQAIKDAAGNIVQGSKQAAKKAYKKGQQIKNKANQKVGQAKQKVEQFKDAAQKKAEQTKEVRRRVKQQADEFEDESILQKIKQKATQVYEKFDKDHDEHVTFEQFTEGVKSGLGFDYEQEEKQQQKSQKDSNSLLQKAKQIYQKYGKQKANQKTKSLNKQDFYSIFRDQRKAKQQRSLLQKTREKASELYKKFDLNEDGHVSIDELTTGLKSGLGFTDQKEESQKDEGSISKYVSDVYDKYIKKDEKNKKWLAEQDFYQIYQAENNPNKKNNCKKSSGLSSEALKSQAHEIHKKLDENKDGHISLDQAASAIRDKIGFTKQDEEDESSLFQYLKNLYYKYIGSGRKDMRVSKDDLADLVYKWKQQCPAKKQKPQMNQL